MKAAEVVLYTAIRSIVDAKMTWTLGLKVLMIHDHLMFLSMLYIRPVHSQRVVMIPYCFSKTYNVIQSSTYILTFVLLTHRKTF